MMKWLESILMILYVEFKALQNLLFADNTILVVVLHCCLVAFFSSLNFSSWKHYDAVIFYPSFVMCVKELWMLVLMLNLLLVAASTRQFYISKSTCWHHSDVWEKDSGINQASGIWALSLCRFRGTVDGYAAGALCQ